MSSELDPVDPFEGPGRYGGHSLFDDDTTTAWVEGVEGQGTGEFIIFRAGEDFPEKLIIHSGYQKSNRLFKMNSRPHTLSISLYAGFYLEGDDTEIASRYRLRPLSGTEVLELGDIMGAQTFNTPFDKDEVMQAKDTLENLFAEDFRKEIENLQALCPTCDPTPRFSFFIRLEIKDVYQGSQWADNCISEISYISSERANIPQTAVAAEDERP
ncbi:MAG: NADase-type glycan-binding domain-containing protein, partial [Bacteroidota bacterium]